MRPLLLPGVCALAAALSGGAAAQESFSLQADYTGSVWAIPVGRVSLTADIEPDGYQARSQVDAAGLAALFSDLRIVSRVEGDLERGRASPTSYAHDEYNRHKHRRIDMSFENGIARSVAAPNFSNWGEPPASEADRAGATDPMSAVLMLSQSMSGREQCSGRIPVFDGRLRYDLELRHRGREQVRTRGWRGEALVCDAFYRPISGYTEDQRPEPRDLRHPLTLWLAPIGEDHYVPVRLQTRAGFGVLVELNSLELTVE